MKTLGTFIAGFAVGIGATLFLAHQIGEALTEEEREMLDKEDEFRFNPCECECHEHEEHNEEVLLTEEDKLVGHYFNNHEGNCECDAFGQEIEEEILPEEIANMTVSTKDLTPQGRAKLEAILGFKLDDNAELDETSMDMLRMAILEQE